MPAETFHDENMPIDLRVAWGNDCGYVQFATIHRDGAEKIIQIVNAWLNHAGHPDIDWKQLQQQLRGGIADNPAFDGWHATIESRAQINRAIATLRRARDQAFGKDE